MKISITDIAKEAGVSPSTVSRVFNERDKVKAKVADRVIAIAANRGYSPHYSTKRETLGVIVEDPDRFRMESYGAMLYNSLIRIASRRHIRLEFFTIDKINSLKDRHLRGALSAVFTEASIASVPKVKSIPVVALNVLIPGVLSVCSDEVSGIRKAMDHLASLGHKRIGFISCDIVTNWATLKRIEAFEDYVKQSPFEAFLGQVQRSNGETEIPRTLAALFKRGATAIIVPGERWGITVMHHLDLIGKSVPEDISIVAGEFEHNSEFLNPPQTCLRQNLDKIVDLAIERSLGEPSTKKLTEETVWVDFDLIVRESTAPLMTQSKA